MADERDLGDEDDSDRLFKKFVSQEDEMVPMSIEEINRLKAESIFTDDEDDSLGLDEIDEEDLETPEEDDE